MTTDYSDAQDKSPIEIYGIVDTNAWRTKLIKSIVVPSAIHPYSLAIEYMRDRWYLPKMSNINFKTIHINGKHIFADQRLFDKIETKQIQKPAVAITPIVDTDYNRDALDLIPGGLSVYTQRTVLDNRFFIDTDQDIHVALDLKELKIQFDFHNRVATRAEQLNMIEHIRLACRIGSTQGEYIDLDCVLPKSIVNAIAYDAGFNMITTDGTTDLVIEDPISFTNYLNKHSTYPITYKFMAINGKMEYFMRIRRCYMHISCLDGISKDDGERSGQLDNNFHVDFSAVLNMPAPSLFTYYSKEKHDIQSTDNSTCGLYQLILTGPPLKNSRAWDLYMKSDYTSDTLDLTTINFYSLIENSKNGKYVCEVLKHNIAIGLSPAIFMEIQMYNDLEQLPITINWEDFEIIINAHVPLLLSVVGVYIDLGYVNSTIANIEALSSTRIENK